MGIKGYKVFNPDWTCRDFQYEVGKEFVHNGNIEMCGKGFHFCQKASDCFNYYNFNSNNKVAEVEALGLVESSDNKSVTDKILIVREIPWHELLTIVNEGNDCTGLCNTGDCNTGDWNTGDCNTGDWNTGDCNTGDWNSCNFSAGFLNSATPKITIFNAPVELDRDSALSLAGLQVLNWNFENSWWIYSQNMSDEEKELHPEHDTKGGYLKTVDFKTACKMMWDKLDDNDRNAVVSLPNFDKVVFSEITGIEV